MNIHVLYLCPSTSFKDQCLYADPTSLEALIDTVCLLCDSDESHGPAYSFNLASPELNHKKNFKPKLVLLEKLIPQETFVKKVTLTWNSLSSNIIRLFNFSPLVDCHQYEGVK